MKQKQLRNENRHNAECMPVSLKNERTSKEFSKCFAGWGIYRALILFALFLGISNLSSAQFQWGIRAGSNASTQSEVGNLCDNNDLKVGLNAGLVGKYQFNNWMAIKSGIDFQQKGLKCESKELNTEFKNNLSYLVLPLKAEFSAGEKAGFKNGRRLFLATGPYFGYLADAKQKIEDSKTDLSDIKGFDFGWSLELGMEFPVLKSNAIQVSLNYDMGLSEIVKDTDIQNKSASVNLGFLF